MNFHTTQDMRNHDLLKGVQHSKMPSIAEESVDKNDSLNQDENIKIGDHIMTEAHAENHD